MQLRKLIPLLVVVTLMIVSSAAIASSFGNEKIPGAQDKPAASDTVSGKYEGTAKSQTAGEIPLMVELKNENGKLSGKIETPQGPAPILGGTYADGKLMMKFDAGGNEGVVNAEYKDDKITGEWTLADMKGTLELKKIAAPANAVSSGDAMKPMAADPISGEWEAAADAQGNNVEFTLKLKLEGEKVSGESASAQGSLPISKGMWASDKLSITLDTPNGQIVLNAKLQEGKLVGEYDFAGQFTGKWEARKK